MLELLSKETVSEVVDLIGSFHSESRYSGYTYLPEKIETLLESILEHPETSVGILYRKDDKIVGVLCATSAEFIFNYQKYTSDLCFYVLPEYRNSRIGLELMKAYEHWSKEIIGADGCTLVNLDDERVHKLYVKKGFEPTERTYLKCQQ
jgi:GNAT superfamily N-acetyltransferase